MSSTCPTCGQIVPFGGGSIPAAFKDGDGEYFPTLEANRRTGEGMKTKWWPDGKNERVIFVGLNLCPETGKPWQVMINGITKNTLGEDMPEREGETFQMRYDLAVFWITRLIQEGNHPQTLFSAIKPYSASPDVKVIDRMSWSLEVVVLEVVLELMKPKKLERVS